MFRFSMLFGMLLVLLSSCEERESDEMQARLRQWDAMLQSNHQSVSDSLETINPSTLSDENKAYYNLLSTICALRGGQPVESDSLITEVADYYEDNPENRENRIRAFIFQGIVRSQVKGHSDSTVFESFKTAGKLLREQVNPKPINGFLINYYLGKTHYGRDNLALAEQYFQKADDFAKKANDTTLILEAQQAIFWNCLKMDKVNKAKLYLDSLENYPNSPPETKSEIAKAKAVYYHTIGDYRNALLSEKEQLAEGMIDKSPFEVSNIFYNISNRYFNINKLDSAMLYGQIAIDYATDSIGKYNYLLYENVADIAEKLGNYKMSNLYRKRSLEAYEHAVQERLNTQIIKLEKQYDLSEAENRALRSKQQTLYLAIALLLLTLILFIVVRIYKSRGRKMEFQLLLAEMKAENQRLETKIMEEEAGKRKWLIKLYGYISERLNILQNNFETLSQKYIASHPKVYESMNEILHSTENDLREFPKELIPSKESFFLYTNMDESTMERFSDNEKIILMLLVCKADNRQIATFMNTTPESTRARKSQLKRKLIELNIDTTPFFQ